MPVMHASGGGGELLSVRVQRHSGRKAGPRMHR